ncbi:hypothetical protein AURDEDRAFT_125046 [Auricularia subglabra TFB-10046 SS5]|nr:hypothetical protein AURDEDRAFT_125046 [Auricularia subglabra TFB-10046 SS5]
MSSLFKQDLDQLIARGGDPLSPVPIRAATPSLASLFISNYTPLCSYYQPNNTVEGVKECPTTEHTLCTQCNSSGADITVIVDRETGVFYFTCMADGCFGLKFARWIKPEEKFISWRAVTLKTAPAPRVPGPTNRMIQLKVLNLVHLLHGTRVYAHPPQFQDDGYFFAYTQHNTEYFSFDDLPDLLVNSRLSFGRPKAIEFRRRVRKTERRWLPFNQSGGSFYIGKEKKLLFRIVNSTVPTPFRFTAPDGHAPLPAHAREVPTDMEDELPVCTPKPGRHIPAAGKKPGETSSARAAARPSTALASQVASLAKAGATGPSTPSTSKTASAANREVIDLTLSDDDEVHAATFPSKISPILLVVDGESDTPAVALGQKRKRNDTVIGKEKKLKKEKNSKGKEKGKGKENDSAI